MYCTGGMCGCFALRSLVKNFDARVCRCSVMEGSEYCMIFSHLLRIFSIEFLSVSVSELMKISEAYSKRDSIFEL